MSFEILHSFNFVVRINGINIGFRKVSGIGQEVEIESYSEGGQNDTVHVFPKAQQQIGTLRLERGMFLVQPGLIYLPGEWIPIINVEVKDVSSDFICKTYTILDAIVKKWEVSDLNAEENGLLINTFEIAYGQIYVV